MPRCTNGANGCSPLINNVALGPSNKITQKIHDDLEEHEDRSNCWTCEDNAVDGSRKLEPRSYSGFSSQQDVRVLKFKRTPCGAPVDSEIWQLIYKISSPASQPWFHLSF